MNRLPASLRIAALYPLITLSWLAAQPAGTPPAPAGTPAAPRPSAVAREATDLLERFVTWLHVKFMPNVDDQLFHWIACGIVILLAIVLRHVITNIIFHYLKKVAAKTETTLDDKLFPALEGPAATLVMVLGIFGALTVLDLSEHADQVVSRGAKLSILGVLLWAAIRAGGAILDHFEEIAHVRQLTVATFMPLIKKTLFVFAFIFGLLVIAQSMGWNVQSFLAGLGIGGLAFALAAQDTIANLFGSFVVVMDQPFRVGDVVKVGGAVGTVEDIGLRSTKIRQVDKSLIVIPNKSVAAESIVNLSRFNGRRVEQVIGLTYDTKADQMNAVVTELRELLTHDADIDPTSVHVYFRDYGASSLDIWLVYVTKNPDFAKSMVLRQRINLAMMKIVEARGLSFAFPTQTLELGGTAAKLLAERK